MAEKTLKKKEQALLLKILDEMKRAIQNNLIMIEEILTGKIQQAQGGLKLMSYLMVSWKTT